jgi:hypothetical protein
MIPLGRQSIQGERQLCWGQGSPFETRDGPWLLPEKQKRITSSLPNLTCVGSRWGQSRLLLNLVSFQTIFSGMTQPKCTVDHSVPELRPAFSLPRSHLGLQNSGEQNSVYKTKAPKALKTIVSPDLIRPVAQSGCKIYNSTLYMAFPTHSPTL